MARGQDPQTVKGGSLSPYVQQSLQAGKGQAENRLLGAMSEAGATSRTRIQEGGASDRTAMQLQGQKAMQAAELENNDKRAAEAEAARREEIKYRKLQQEDQQAFLTEQSRLDQEFNLARDEKDYDREDAALERMLDNNTLQSMIDAESSRQQNKVILAMATMSQKGETAKQRMITSLAEDADVADREAEIHSTMKGRVAEAAKLDRRMDAPIAGVLETRAGTPRKIQMFGGGAGYDVSTTEEYILPGSQADPMGVLQDQMRGNGSKLSVGELLKDSGTGIVSKIQSGELSKTDLQSAVSTLDGMVDAIQLKLDDAKGKYEPIFWRRNMNDVKQMRMNIGRMMHDKSKIGEGGTQTVGSLVRDALSSIDGLSTGSQIAKMKESYADSAQSAEAYLKELSRAIEVPGLLAAPENASPFMLDLVNRRNEARLSAFPTLENGGTQ